MRLPARLLGSLILAPALTVIAACAGSAEPQIVSTDPASAAELGRWVTESGNLEVEVAPCGPALCGAVAKVLANRSMADPSAAMAAAPPAIGLQILSDFRPTAAGPWRGRIFNRENGQSYDCEMSLAAPDALRLRIFVGMLGIERTQVWRRPGQAGQG